MFRRPALLNCCPHTFPLSLIEQLVKLQPLLNPRVTPRVPPPPPTTWIVTSAGEPAGTSVRKGSPRVLLSTPFQAAAAARISTPAAGEAPLETLMENVTTGGPPFS